jgi:magnesium-transporting ATPase (P-type)
VILVTKGADDAVLPLLRGGGGGAARLEEEEEALVHLTQAQLDEFASFGLRTLLVAWRHMRREEYEEWESGVLREAEMSLEGREARVGAAYEALERGSVLIGATAIEDKLQPNVAATIGVLREAGISTWMVTGDKLSTAKQVGGACGLIRSGEELVTFDDPAKIDQTLKQLAHALAYADGSGRAWRERCHGATGETLGLVVVLTGSCLAAMSEGELAAFAKHAVHAQAGVCCRLTPDQKAVLVNMLRNPQVQHQLILRRSREAAADGDELVFGLGKRWGHGWIEELERRVLGREAVICAIGQFFF